MSSNPTSNTDHQSSTTTSETMPPPALRIDPSRASTLLANLSQINSRISSTCKTHSIRKRPRLVAVSKLKPATDILALHQPPPNSTENEGDVELSPQIHFGENYVQELIEKSRLLPPTIRWHFIGGLQSNKCAQLAREVPSLWAVESVDTVKKAQLLCKGRAERSKHKHEHEKKQKDDTKEVSTSTSTSSPASGETEGDDKLRIFVQINTSGESSKSGLEPQSTDLLTLCRTIREDLASELKLQGLMTIGAIARSQATTPETENEDFVALRECRDWVAEQLDLQKGELELSMGMSEDFEGAIVQGSDEVRVGSTIFGERPPKKEAKVLETTTEEGKT